MKLSAAIEMALTERRYHPANPYMCNAMYSMGHSQHEASIQEMVDSIAMDKNGDGLTLSQALKQVDKSKMSWTLDDMFEYTKQLYCWWVFDLKRKGL